MEWPHNKIKIPSCRAANQDSFASLYCRSIFSAATTPMRMLSWKAAKERILDLTAFPHWQRFLQYWHNPAVHISDTEGWQGQKECLFWTIQIDLKPPMLEKLPAEDALVFSDSSRIPWTRNRNHLQLQSVCTSAMASPHSLSHLPSLSFQWGSSPGIDTQKGD